MNSIAKIFNNSKQLLDSVSSFVDRYIGSSLLRRYGISKIVDQITENRDLVYYDNPVLRLFGDVEHSNILKKCVSAKDMLIDKLLVCFSTTSAYT